MIKSYLSREGGEMMEDTGGEGKNSSVCVLTENSLIVDQIEVDHGHRCPDTQQGQHDEPGEEAAAGTGVSLLPVLIGRLGFSSICNTALAHGVRDGLEQQSNLQELL